METFDFQCHDVEIDGSLAREWCVDHQVVRLADNSMFGKWRLKREMRNQASVP